MLNKLLLIFPLLFIATQNIAQPNFASCFGESCHLNTYAQAVTIGEEFLAQFPSQKKAQSSDRKMLLGLPFIYIGDEDLLPKSKEDAKEKGSKILAIFGMMHWIFIGIIVLGVVWGGVSKLFARDRD